MVAMHVIEPDMVLGKPALDADGGSLGEVVDVGLFSHSRVKFLVVKDDGARIPVRTVDVQHIADVTADAVRVHVHGP